MIKRYIIWIGLLFFLSRAISQQDTVNSQIKKNIIHAELGGNGVWGSINYERIFLIKKQKFSARIGGFYDIEHPISYKVYSPPWRGVSKDSSNISKEFNYQTLSIPIELNYLIPNKKNPKLVFDIGLGLVYQENILATAAYLKDRYSKGIYLTLKVLSYRFQSDNFFMRFNLVHFFQLVEFNKNYQLKKENEFMFVVLHFYPAFSIGYAF